MSRLIAQWRWLLAHRAGAPGLAVPHAAHARKTCRLRGWQAAAGAGRNQGWQIVAELWRVGKQQQCLPPEWAKAGPDPWFRGVALGA